MNLPIFFDIAIGLFFIYLILSLLAFELQELIATLLQWRGRHLEKAIQSLLCGGNECFSKKDLEKAQAKLEKTRAKVEKIELEKTIAEIEQAIAEVEKTQKLVKALYNAPLINALNHQGNKISIPSYIPSETFASTLLNELKIPHLVQKAQKDSDLKLIFSFYPELKTTIQKKDSETYDKIKGMYGEIDQELEKLINELPDDVPKSLLRSLEVLALRSQNKVHEIDEQLNQLRKEVETYFDRSMDRTTGVYKRNAKKVAILIGFAIAILTNTDTFHIISRLSRDTALRTAITNSASQEAELYNKLSKDNKDTDEENQIYKALNDVSLPIGWSHNNFKEQFGFNINIDNIKQYKFDFWNLLKTLRVLLGWLLSGLAIAMGAPFWFDLLGKVINVRNAGPKPESYTKDQPSVRK